MSKVESKIQQTFEYLSQNLNKYKACTFQIFYNFMVKEPEVY